LGFSSHSHFTAAFRRGFGCTPSQFRESTRRTLKREPSRLVSGFKEQCSPLLDSNPLSDRRDPPSRGDLSRSVLRRGQATDRV
jgi:hypothetical protein